MARQNRKTEVLSHVRTVEQIVAAASPNATTLSAAAAAAAGSISVASITGYAVGQTIAVGRGERKEIVKVHPSTAPASGTITLDTTTPLQYDHDLGDPVEIQQLIDLGAVHGDGATISYDGEPTDIAAENQSFLLAQKTGFLEIVVEFGLLGLMVENLCAALGLALSRITGSGTTGAPRELYLDATDQNGMIGEVSDAAFRLTAVRKDGTVLQWDCFACEIDPTAVQIEVGRGVVTKVPVRLKVTGGVLKRASLN